jgi:class 3 adenylate cyclase
VTQIRGFAELIYGLFICLLILTYTVYLREKTLRFYSNITKAANKELKRINELLTEMMPKHVFETLREQNTVTEKIKNATILYADIVGFTQWSSSKTPGQVVNMLSDLFTQFDMKCKEHQVYKVHTIGDCYVAMGYLEADNRDFKQECKNLIYFALDLVKIIQEVNLERGIELNMRIGVHTGDIIGGITGTSIVRYDIYGVDVLIANKMESSGQPGKVKVSQETFDVLSKNFNGGFKFVEDKVIEVAGKKIKTYFVELNN